MSPKLTHKQQNILNISLEDTRLNCRSQSHSFVGVNTPVRFFPKKLFYRFIDCRHTRLTPN